MSLIEDIQGFKLPLELFSPIVSRKIKGYAAILDLMDEHGGWLPYPDLILKYLDSIGAKHWADLYFREGIEKSLKDNNEQIVEFRQFIIEATGADPSPEDANEFLSELLVSIERDLKADDKNPADSYFEQFNFENVDVEKLSAEERKEHCNFWITYHVSFYNDLALATHGESIYTLVQKAIELEDDDALVKAVQIDRSLLPYFQDRLFSRAMQGDSNFFDSLAYRINNPPRRGANKHPLLWILFKELYQLGCLRRSITSKQILDVYQKAIPDHPKFSIYDELTVQRQRRNFMSLYRQAK
jgi:hypothetical protein